MAKFEFNIGDEFSLGAGKPAIGQAGANYTVFEILSTVIKNLYVLVGVVLLIMVFVGGLGLIFNAGNAEAQKKSSKTLSSAMVGFAILIGAYWIIKIIEIIFDLSIFKP